MNTLTPEQERRILALLRAGKSLRRIEHETGHRRETIAAYGRRAGVLHGNAVSVAIHETASACEPYRERIARALNDGHSLRAIHTHLAEREGLIVSYSALRRYVRVASLRTQREGTMLAAA